jgi:hypothetical protein
MNPHSAIDAGILTPAERTAILMSHWHDQRAA